MIKRTFLIFVLGIFLLFGFTIFFKSFGRPVSNDISLQDFMIAKGSSASKIGVDLEKQGLIKSSLAFKTYVQFTGKQNKIVAGEFELSPAMSLYEVVQSLQKGPVQIWVTIPEGLRHEEIAQKFSEGLEKDDQFTKDFISLASAKEGYLFPDTYLFPKSVTSQKIIEKMLLTFDQVAGEDITYKQVIMASIIERETKGNEEKPVVAGILYKRLENDWPLQVDATIQYAKGNWKPILSSDKELNSPYNTYKFTGFPPSPISNPGEASLKASMNPEPSDYWYYIHDESGTIHYARDLDEHNANIQKYLW